MLAKLAPVAVGVMSSFMRSNELDENGLADLLGGQGKFLQSVLPSDLGDLFGLAGLGQRAEAAAGSAVSSAGDVAASAASEGRSWLRTAVPVLALLAVAWFGYQLLSGGGDDGQLPAVSARPPSASLVTDVLGDCTTALSAVSDAQTARAALPALEAANRAIDQVLAQSETIPADARGAIAGQAQDYIPQLQKLMAKAAGMPGASDVLSEQVAQLMQNLSRAAAI